MILADIGAIPEGSDRIAESLANLVLVGIILELETIEMLGACAHNSIIGNRSSRMSHVRVTHLR